METDQSLPGRVVRLHFQCRAELPIGSSLRVTGSSLWAPTHVTAEDPTQAQTIASQTVPQAQLNSSPASEDWVDVTVLNQSHASMYTSSIEMYTTPETYPFWRTRRPVVVILNKQSGIHHHYYRYLVVTPGAKPQDAQRNPDTMEDDGDVSDAESDRLQVATTSNDHSGMSQVMLWEDPFEKLDGSNLCNLPYRTIDINAVTTEVVDTDRVDNWNGAEDPSFQPYLIRDAVRFNGFRIHTFIPRSFSHSLHFRLIKRIAFSPSLSSNRAYMLMALGLRRSNRSNESFLSVTIFPSWWFSPRRTEPGGPVGVKAFSLRQRAPKLSPAMKPTGLELLPRVRPCQATPINRQFASC